MDDTFRKRLKRLRISESKTQDDMAVMLGVKRSTYGEYERGKIMPPVDKIEQIAEILGVKPHFLIGWDTPEVYENVETSALAERIRKLRSEKHKSLEEMAAEIGISKDILLQYEKGIRKIPYTAVKKMARYFGIDIALLYGIEFDTGSNTKEALKENVQRLKMAEVWNREVGKAMFNDEELAELINYAKYIISKRNK